MLCSNVNCTEDHVQNPTTGQCVEKNSYLAKMIEKHKSANTINSVKSLSLELTNTIHDEFQEIFKRFQFFSNQDELKFSQLQDLKDELYEIKTDVKKIFKFTEILDKQNELIQKQTSLLNELQFEMLELKSSMDLLNKEEKLSTSKSEEEHRVINILRESYNIVSSSEKDNPINSKIKAFLGYVRNNIEKGKKTNVTNELIKTFF